GMALCAEHGFAQMLAVGTILQGWALTTQGKEEEGIAQMRQGLVAVRGTGAEIARPRYLALLAEAYGQAGQAAEGLAKLGEALTVEQHTGERLYEADFNGLIGDLMLQWRVRS